MMALSMHKQQPSATHRTTFGRVEQAPEGEEGRELIDEPCEYGAGTLGWERACWNANRIK